MTFFRAGKNLAYSISHISNNSQLADCGIVHCSLSNSNYFSNPSANLIPTFPNRAYVIHYIVHCVLATRDCSFERTPVVVCSSCCFDNFRLADWKRVNVRHSQDYIAKTNKNQKKKTQKKPRKKTKTKKTHLAIDNEVAYYFFFT